MLNIVIFGAPGSGKGTQSENLIEHYKLFHISTGDVLRDHMRRGTELGKTAKEFIDQGQLIPDELMIGILAQVIDDNKDEAQNGVIFDGFPRTIPQAEALETLLNERGTSVSAVVGLEVPEQELIDRLVKRGLMSGRSDDNEETIKKRLDVYHNQTSPLQEFYKEKGLYHAIKGIGTIEDIFDDIKAAIDQINKCEV
ncbi:MAG: adenylate kinase [Muribaculaceae bacterium]|nr:adenylate kinase [Muribaculaceae bacterium]